MLKLAMALLAGLGCCVLGYSISNASGKRLRMVWESAQAIRLIRSGICVHGEMLPKVLCSLPEDGSQEMRVWASFYARVGRSLATQPNLLLQDVWGQAWIEATKEHSALLVLTEEDTRLFSPLIEELGRTPRAQQQVLLDQVQADWLSQHERLQKKLADTQKVSQTLGLLGGLAMFLLLL